MIIADLFKKKCKHEKTSNDNEFCYCPDCGKLIENQWYIVRCSCCGIKHKAVIKHGNILSAENYCNNCGCKDFVVERLDNINFIDINYAVLIKEITEKNVVPFTQTWVDTREEYYKPKLLKQTR